MRIKQVNHQETVWQIVKGQISMGDAHQTWWQMRPLRTEQ